jgi:hypothetical protein
MASHLPNFYKLRKGAIFDGLFPMDFLDVIWQAFEKDELESITLEMSEYKKRLKMRVIEVVKKTSKLP